MNRWSWNWATSLKKAYKSASSATLQQTMDRSCWSAKRYLWFTAGRSVSKKITWEAVKWSLILPKYNYLGLMDAYNTANPIHNTNACIKWITKKDCANGNTRICQQCVWTNTTKSARTSSVWKMYACTQSKVWRKMATHRPGTTTQEQYSGKSAKVFFSYPTIKWEIIKKIWSFREGVQIPLWLRWRAATRDDKAGTSTRSRLSRRALL